MKFMNNVISLENKYGISIYVRNHCNSEDMGSVTFTIEPNVGCIEMFYDFKPDPDYPIRDTFVTLRYYGGRRDDFATFEEAFERFEQIVKEFVKVEDVRKGKIMCGGVMLNDKK